MCPDKMVSLVCTYRSWKGKPTVGRRHWFAKPTSPWALEDRTLSLPFMMPWLSGKAGDCKSLHLGPIPRGIFREMVELADTKDLKSRGVSMQVTS